jgi:hypothetical protein
MPGVVFPQRSPCSTGESNEAMQRIPLRRAAERCRQAVLEGPPRGTIWEPWTSRSSAISPMWGPSPSPRRSVSCRACGVPTGPAAGGSAKALPRFVSPTARSTGRRSTGTKPSMRGGLSSVLVQKTWDREFPHIPFRRRRRSIWPISTTPAVQGRASRHTSPEPEAVGETRHCGSTPGDSTNVGRRDVRRSTIYAGSFADANVARKLNPRDATIQCDDARRWGRRQASLRGRPLVVTSTRPPLDNTPALTDGSPVVRASEAPRRPATAYCGTTLYGVIVRSIA